MPWCHLLRVPGGVERARVTIRTLIGVANRRAFAPSIRVWNSDNSSVPWLALMRTARGACLQLAIERHAGEADALVAVRVDVLVVMDNLAAARADRFETSVGGRQAADAAAV